MAEDVNNTEINLDQNQKVDVCLVWKDFCHALEESRHQCQEDAEKRDWFKLNSLEIVFLGCESVLQGRFTRRKLGTIMIGIEDISYHLWSMPRLFTQMLQVLVDQMSTDVCSIHMWQKCWKLLSGMMAKTKQNLRLRFYALDVAKRNIERLITDAYNQPFDLRNQVKELEVELDQCQEAGMEICQRLGIGSHVKDNIALQIQPLIGAFGENYVHALWKELQIDEFLQEVQDGISDMQDFLLNLVCILQIKTQEEDDESEIKLRAVVRIFREVNNAVRKWLEYHPGPSMIPCKILTYIFVSFCSMDRPVTNIDEYLEAANISKTLDAFMTFAFEGERSNLATEIFGWLLELLMSSCEAGVAQSKVILTHIQNLLGPVFGCNDARILCRALEYGSLAFKSKHRKSLLGEGLWFMRRAHLLFKSREDMKEEMKKCQSRIDAVSIATEVVEEIMSMTVTKDEELSTHKDCINNSKHSHRETQEHGEKYIILNGIQVDAQSTDQLVTELDKDGKICDNELNDILHLMYKLACAIVKNGEAISYTFASVLPKLFQPTYLQKIPESLPKEYFKEFKSNPSHIPWRVSKNYLARKVLKLCATCMEYRSSTSFQICSVMIPKLVKNLDRTELTDSQKLAALFEFIDTCHSKAQRHDSVNALIGYGIDLISLLLPKGLDVNGLKEFLPRVLKNLVKILNSTSLLFLRNSCDFFMNNFPAENEKLKMLFFKLLQKGKKNDIRSIYLLSGEWITHPRFDFVLEALCKYESGMLKPRQLQSMCEILTCLVDIEKKLKKQLEEHLKENREITDSANIGIFTRPLLGQLQEVLSVNEFNIDAERTLIDKASYLALYLAFYPDEILQTVMKNDGDESMNEIAHIPDDVRDNAELMNLLLTSARRIEHMQLPRFHALKLVLTDVLKGFLKNEVSRSMSLKETEVVEELSGIEAECTHYRHKSMFLNQTEEINDLDAPSIDRSRLITLHLKDIPANKKILQRLQDCGYKLSMFDDDIVITVQTTGGLNIEENLRQTLLALFIGYLELLKQLGIPAIKIGEKSVKLEEIFSDELTLNELKGRRAIVVKIIEKQTSHDQQINICDRKLRLLSEEERIEAEMESMASAQLKRKTFKAKLNTSFFDCAACCGPQIVGCYAPNGDHCQRPLEIGMRYDSAFASIYDENGTEIENAELLFMDQGVFVFRAYSNGHPYDTSQVWVSFFEEIIEKRGLVPAIILAHHMPNRHTWETIRRAVPTVLTGTILSCQFDFSAEWRTYYDFRPEVVHCGKDIILVKGFASLKYPHQLQRQFSASNSKDLGGLLFDYAMKSLVKDDVLQEFRFLGRAIAEYISDITDTGQECSEIISNQFNFEKWYNKRCHNKGPITKIDVIERIRKLIRVAIHKFINDLDLGEMFEKQRRQFFQLKKLLEKRGFNKDMKHITKEICEILKNNTFIQHIDYLPLNVQEEVMHWIFGNEDRVWRYRGGRDGYETIHQYLRFLTHIRNENSQNQISPAFPGVLILIKRNGRFHTDSLQVNDIAGYAVGEYVKEFSGNEDENETKLADKADGENHEEQYEIVTAWVNPDYRGLRLSTHLYLEIFKSVSSQSIAFDVLKDTTKKIIESSPVLKLLTALVPLSFIIRTQRASYNVATSAAVEQFERLFINRWPVRAALTLYEKASLAFKYRYFILIPVIICMLAIIIGKFVFCIFE